MKKSSGESVGTSRSFNLVDEPWIPVVDAADETCKVGLRELFERSEELVDLSVGTLERISLYRLLICIAQRALVCDEKGGGGLQNNDEDEWREAGERFVDAALVYLDQWRDRFDLWGDQPFLQVKALTSAKKKKDEKNKTDKLDFGLAAGNNKTLFDQASTPEGREHESDWLARNLLVYLAFSSSGTIGKATIGKRETGGNSKNAPCVERCMLFTFLKGKNLRQTIAWNMIPFDDEDLGTPAWEYDDWVSESAMEELAESYAGRLVPVARFVRLEEDGQNVVLADGVTYPQFNPKKHWVNREPMAAIIETGDKKEPWNYVKIDPDRRPWRSLHAMLDWSAFKEKSDRCKGAWNLMNIARISEEERRKSKKFAIWVGGLKANQGKIIDSAYWSANIPWSYVNDTKENTRISTYARGVKLANGAEKRLIAAIKKYCERLGASTQTNAKSRTSLVVQAKNRFWTALERRVDELIAEAAEDKSGLKRWKETLKRELIDAYEKTCACVTARQIRAFAEGKVFLFGLNNKSGDDKNASTDKPKRTKAKK